MWLKLLTIFDVKGAKKALLNGLQVFIRFFYGNARPLDLPSLHAYEVNYRVVRKSWDSAFSKLSEN